MPSLAFWRMSVDRMRADWPIVTAAWLVTLLAATLLAVGPIYSSAVSLAGLHRVLADADVQGVNVSIGLRPSVQDMQRVDEIVREQARQALGQSTTIVLSGRSGSFALPGQPADDVRDLTVMAFQDDLAAHVSLVSGAWPGEAAAGGMVGVAVSEQAAALLEVELADELRLDSRLDDDLTVTARVDAIFRIGDPADAYWWGDDSLLSGVQEGPNYRTIGPLFAFPSVVAQYTASPSISLDWHVFPEFAGLQVTDIGGLRASLADLQPRLEVALAGLSPTVTTDLGGILASAERSLLVSRTGVLLLIVQLAVLAAYAIVLTAGLLVEHRRIDTALLRSRGANPLQVALLALLEALVLAIPAALLAPWLAGAALRVLNAVGPLAEVGVTIDPRVALDAQVAAAAAAAGCAVLLVLPAFMAARSFAAEESGRSRQETRTIGQRLGIDIALLALTAVALWQLRLYGAPLTQNVRGTLGLDPLLVAAPAIALLAGGVVALRIMPLMARALEWLVARGRHLVGSLGSRQLSRRPLRYTRAALLLMLAISIGVFAVSYGSTWSRSQIEQADHQVGPDIRFTPPEGRGSLPPWAMADALRSLPGVRAVAPVTRDRLAVSRAAGNADLLGLDATAAGMVRLRGDLAPAPITEVMAPLVEARPAVRLVSLPGAPVRLRVEADVSMDELVRSEFDFEQSEFVPVPVDPGVLDGRPIVQASVVLRDADGLLHQLNGEEVGLAPGTESVIISLAPPGGEGPSFSYPLDVVGMDLNLFVPGETQVVGGRAGIAGLAYSESVAGDDWREVDLQSAGGWRLSFAATGPPQELTADQVDGQVMPIESGTRLMGVALTNGQPSSVHYLASSAARIADEALVVAVNDQLLRGTALALGDTLQGRMDGVARGLRIAAALTAFPTADPTRSLLITDGLTLSIVRYAAAGGLEAPDEWWLDVTDGAGAAVAAALRAEPIGADEVVARHERVRALSADPVALGIIGALGVGFVVAGLFAVIGLAVSAAVSARQRQTEFALLRALGLSAGQLARWLWLENGALVLVSMTAGTALGLAIGWVVLPFITVTQGGEVPYPPVALEVPWLAIGLLELISLATLVLTVLLLAAVLRRIGIGRALRMGED